MKKIRKPIILILLLFSLASISLNSCRDLADIYKDINPFEGEFYEIDNLSDSMWISGSLAAPILNTKLSLIQLLPDSTDNTLWVEVDNQDLIHLRSYFDSLVVITASQIYSELPAVNGTNIPAGTYQVQSDTSKLKIYSKALAGHLFFNDPKFTFKFVNEIPIVSFFRLDTITFHEVAGTQDSVTHTSHTNYEIARATAQGVGAKSQVVIDKTVIPQFPEIFSPIPKYVSFCITVGSELDQVLPWDMSGDEEIVLDVDIDLPLDARLYDFVLGDTVPFDLTTNTYKQVDSLELRLEIDNGFPFKLETKITFMDSLNTYYEVYQFDGNNYWLIAAANTDAVTGQVTSSVISRGVILLDQITIQRFIDKKISRFTFNSTINTTNQPEHVKIFSNYAIGLKVGVKLNFGGRTTDI